MKLDKIEISHVSDAPSSIRDIERWRGKTEILEIEILGKLLVLRDRDETEWENTSTSSRYVIDLTGPGLLSFGGLGGGISSTFASLRISTSYRYVIDTSRPDLISLGDLEQFLVLW